MSNNSTALSTHVLSIGRIDYCIALAIAVDQLEQAQAENPFEQQAREWHERCECERRDIADGMQRERPAHWNRGW